jgi:hypothetical protein
MIAAALALFGKAGVKLPLVVMIAAPVALVAALGGQVLARRTRAARATPAEP